MNKKSKAIILSVSLSLGITMLLMFVALIVLIITTNTYSTQLENSYKHNFYELSTNINDIEVDMSKLVATNDTNTRREVLTNIYTNCNMANNNISMLPVSNNKISKVNNFINRLGGYAYSLITKVNTDVEFSDYDYETIEDLHTESLYLMTEYNNYVSGLKFNYKILSDVDFGDEDKSSFNAGLISSENSKVPTLIYDGPFSDSVLNKEIKGLGDNEIDRIGAKDIVLNKLNFLNIVDIEYEGEGSGDFNTYNFEIETSDKREFYVQVSKFGGEIVDITGYGDGGENSYSINECISVAEDFATKLGYEDMHQVWYAENGNIVYINLAPIKNKVIYYPDLVKVKVDKRIGVIALEGKDYWYNHIDRTLGKYEIDFNTAQNNLSKALTVKERNVALIPNKFVGETLTYEFICTWKDYTYYIYIDVSTGEEVNILRVVKTTAGDLII